MKMMYLRKVFLFCAFVTISLPLLSCRGEGGEDKPIPVDTDPHTRILAEWRTSKRSTVQANLDNLVIRQGGNEMKYWFTTYGTEPAGGHSLWISMHGGGGTTHDVNDSQWENQKGLYKPSEGIYLCPRAPWDAWNMWFQEPIDALFEELIMTMIVGYGVNPDKVYLMGYSAGGDGVWRLAPRLADHWAAASMMAGHPGDVSLLNVRNLPFTLWVGALDSAYDRNVQVAARGEELDSLQAADPEGYIHSTHVVAGKPHWMDLRDAQAVPWMAKYTRNPYPKYIIWQQEEVLRPTFYWLRAPKYELARGKQVIVDVKNNVITLSRCDYSQLTFLLNDQLVDFSRPVTVRYNDSTLFEGTVTPDEAVMRATLAERNDPRYMFDAELTIHL